MRPMMRLILGLCALVVILAAVSFALPNHVTVPRSVVINAPEPVVFPYLNNLHRFNDWSPWAARDPQLQVRFSGPEEGKGAKVEWTSGQRSVGPGSMEITAALPTGTSTSPLISTVGRDELLRCRAIRIGQQGHLGLRLRHGHEPAETVEGLAARSLCRGRIS